MRELESNLRSYFRIMKGVIELRSPLELNFEGISEIKYTSRASKDVHDFPMTTKFINEEMIRPRHPTLDSNKYTQNSSEKKNLYQRFDSNLSLEKSKQELSELFKARQRINAERKDKNWEVNEATAISEKKEVDTDTCFGL